MFLQRIEFEVEEKAIECNELNNEILIIKKIVKEEKYVRVKENQLAILNQNGKILDLRGEPGLYEIKEGDMNLPEEWQFEIQKAEDESLNVLFINRADIVDNKFYILEPITYIDWTYEDEPIETKIKGEVIFNFTIDRPQNFLRLVIGLRDNYAKHELIEQIRPFIIKSIQDGIKELSNDYKVDIRTLITNPSSIKVKVKENKYDNKLLDKGIKVTFFDFINLEVDSNTRNILEVEDKFKDVDSENN